jgi:subtilisin family serine protease
MSGQLTQDLKSKGVAECIVILNQPIQAAAAAAAGALPVGAASADLGGAAVRGVAKYFASAETAQASALATAAASGRPMTAAARMGKVSAKRGASAPPPQVRVYPNLGVMFGTVDREGLAGLRADPRVKAVTGAPPLSLIRPQMIAKARRPGKVTWGIRALGIPALWNQGLTGKGVRIGHLDTGVDGTHPALREAIHKFTEFDDFGREVQPAPRPYDTEDHGTHTAATIAGRAVRGSHIGVAPASKLVSAIVIEGGQVVARVLGGMDWALGNSIRILSMSLGFRGWWEDFIPLMALLRTRGVLPVFAVGNEGPGTSRSPGNYSEALSVGAYAQNGDVAYFSSSQQFQRPRDPAVPDMVAPGVGIVSAKPNGGFQSMDGSSMATPHVAGLAALLMEAHPSKSVDEVVAAIIGAGQLKPGMPADRGGRGVPNGGRALKRV